MHGEVVDLHHRILGGGLLFAIAQGHKPRGHRIPFDRRIGHAPDVEDHVIGGEGVTIGPCGILPDLQRIGARVIRHFPAFQKRRGETAIRLPPNQRFAELTGDVGLLGPVVDARVVDRQHLLTHPQHAAPLGGLCQCGTWQRSQTSRGPKAEDA